MINVLVNGYKGKMGSEVVKAVALEPDMALVGTTDLGDDLGAKIRDTAARVAVDFTHPSCALANARRILEAGAHAVVGTTGLSETDLAELAALAQSQSAGIMVCPNFAIGAVLMMKMAAIAAKHMPEVEIIELHHNRKADAPSGTAMKTAEMIAAANPDINGCSASRQETELVPGARGGTYQNIHIHSVRLPGYIAHQEVIFGGMGQTLSLRHDTTSRESFMPGVLISIRHVLGVTGLVYGLETIL